MDRALPYAFQVQPLVAGRAEGAPCCTPVGAAARQAPARGPGDSLADVTGSEGGGDGGEGAHDMAVIPAGAFTYGCNRREGAPGDGEGPARLVTVPAFLIDRCAVTNARFANFITATGYITQAERLDWSFVFAGLLPDDFAETRGVAAAPWWRQVSGADWRHPEGPQSTLDGRSGLPVVHISHDDARAFCAWAKKRLPTEAEWEKAARGGLENQRFPWGDEETPGGIAHCNVWQGRFPDYNQLDDGYYGLAPADAFPANGYGLHNMVGNAWEWCADWFSTHRFPPGSDPAALTMRPPDAAEGDLRVLRGGSYLCHPSYCWRYRNAARSAAAPDSATGHIGFRCARDAPE